MTVSEKLCKMKINTQTSIFKEKVWNVRCATSEWLKFEDVKFLIDHRSSL